MIGFIQVLRTPSPAPLALHRVVVAPDSRSVAMASFAMRAVVPVRSARSRVARRSRADAGPKRFGTAFAFARDRPGAGPAPAWVWVVGGADYCIAHEPSCIRHMARVFEVT